MAELVAKLSEKLEQKPAHEKAVEGKRGRARIGAADDGATAWQPTRGWFPPPRWADGAARAAGKDGTPRQVNSDAVDAAQFSTLLWWAERVEIAAAGNDGHGVAIAPAFPPRWPAARIVSVVVGPSSTRDFPPAMERT